MKKPKKPGENISLKTKKNESPMILDWINSQTNLMDSLRYLIEEEVKVKGIRNLQNYIPADRSFSIGSVHPTANSVIISNIQNEEIAATKEDTADEWLEAPHVLTHDSTEDDEIDEEDIDSWT